MASETLPEFRQPIQTPKNLTIFPGRAEVMRYDQEPATVIVGDGGVAIAAIAASDILVLTGLSAGMTNVIVLDAEGVEIDHIILRVALPGRNIVVHRALEREVLRCDPGCIPTTDEAAVSDLPPPVQPPAVVQNPDATAAQ